MKRIHRKDFLTVKQVSFNQTEPIFILHGNNYHYSTYIDRNVKR